MHTTDRGAGNSGSARLIGVSRESGLLWAVTYGASGTTYNIVRVALPPRLRAGALPRIRHWALAGGIEALSIDGPDAAFAHGSLCLFVPATWNADEAVAREAARRLAAERTSRWRAWLSGLVRRVREWCP